MKRLIVLVVALIWSISVFAAMPPFDHKVKINPTNTWATVTNQTANYDDESKFGLIESLNTWSVNVADNNDVLPASVVWKDQHNVQHIVILRDRAATFTIIVPVIGNVAFIGADGGGERRDVNVGINSWQKIQFSINATGGILIEGVSLEGSSFVNQAKWKGALIKATTGVDLYTAIGKKPTEPTDPTEPSEPPEVSGPYYHQVKISDSDAWENVTAQTVNYTELHKFGNISDTFNYGKDTIWDFTPSERAPIVYFRDGLNIQHAVRLTDHSSEVALILPVEGKFTFSSKDTFDRDFGFPKIYRWVYLKFTIENREDYNLLRVRVRPLEGYNYLTEVDWKIAHALVVSGVNIYDSLDIKYSPTGIHFVKVKPDRDWVNVSAYTGDFVDLTKFGAQSYRESAIKPPYNPNRFTPVDKFPVEFSFTDTYGVQHFIRLNDIDSKISIVVPIQNNLFIKNMNSGLVVQMNLKYKYMLYAKLKFYVEEGENGKIVPRVFGYGAKGYTMEDYEWTGWVLHDVLKGYDIYRSVARWRASK